MTPRDYSNLIETFLAEAKTIRDAKQPGYIVGSGDVLANFKRAAQRAGVTPEQAWVIYASKHWDAICAIMAHPHLPVSEAPIGRFADLANYLLLGWALLQERENQE